jgi:hypothetical protein
MANFFGFVFLLFEMFPHLVLTIQTKVTRQVMTRTTQQQLRISSRVINTGEQQPAAHAVRALAGDLLWIHPPFYSAIS